MQCQIHNQQTREVLQVGLNYRIPHNLCAFHCITITSIAFGVILQKMQPGRNNSGQMLLCILQLLHKLCSFVEKKLVISLLKISHRRLCFLIQYVVNCNGWKNSFKIPYHRIQKSHPIPMILTLTTHSSYNFPKIRQKVKKSVESSFLFLTSFYLLYFLLGL